VKKITLFFVLGIILAAGALHSMEAKSDADSSDLPSFWIPGLGWIKDVWPDRLFREHRPDIWLSFNNTEHLQNQGLGLQDAFAALAQLPTPVITVALPNYSDAGTTYAVAAATDTAGQILSSVERDVTYLSSHLGLSLGLSGAVGLTSTPVAGVLAGIGNSLGISVHLSDFIVQAFNAIRLSFWQVGLRPADQIIVPSPLTFLLGNPDQSLELAQLNPRLPVRFEKQNGQWAVTSAQGVYHGHVGIIELYTEGPLDDLRFDGLSQGMSSPVNVIIAGTDAQGSLAAARLFHPSSMNQSEQVKTLVTLLKSSLTCSPHARG